MAELTKGQMTDLLDVIRTIVPDAKFSSEESYSGNEVDFKNSCSCYSEWTTDSCELQVTITTDVAKDLSDDDQWKLRSSVEKAVEQFAHNNLTWTGCNCCGSVEEDYYPISVNVLIFERKKR